MEIIKLSKEYEKEYDEFVLNHPKALFYYQLRYRDLLKDVLECEDEYYILIDKDKIRAILPILSKSGKFGKVYNLLPHYGSNGSILAESEEYYNLLLEKYNDLIKSVAASTYIENPLDMHPKKADCDYKVPRICQFSIFEDSVDMSDLSKLFTSNKRRNIRRAIKGGVSVSIDNSKEAKEFLFKTHIENMQAINGAAKSKELFEGFYKRYESDRDYNIFVAYKDKKAVAALLVFYFNGVTEYYTPVILEEFRVEQPLALIIYEAMKYSVERGLLLWNWGANGGGSDGVYRFKKSWGAVDYLYDYYIKVNNKDILYSNPKELLQEYPNFFVIPFDRLKER